MFDSTHTHTTPKHTQHIHTHTYHVHTAHSTYHIYTQHTFTTHAHTTQHTTHTHTIHTAHHTTHKHTKHTHNFMPQLLGLRQNFSNLYPTKHTILMSPADSWLPQQQPVLTILWCDSVQSVPVHSSASHSTRLPLEWPHMGVLDLFCVPLSPGAIHSTLGLTFHLSSSRTQTDLPPPIQGLQTTGTCNKKAQGIGLVAWH